MEKLSSQVKDIPEICWEVAYWDNDKKHQRRIVCAANRYKTKDGEWLVIPSVRHYSREHRPILDGLNYMLESEHAYDENQGFVDQYSNYWTREEALIIATHAQQINTVKKKTAPFDVLFSEDLY